MTDIPRVSETELVQNIGQYKCTFCDKPAETLSFSEHLHPLPLQTPPPKIQVVFDHKCDCGECCGCFYWEEREKNGEPFDERTGYVFGVCCKCCTLVPNMLYQWCCICLYIRIDSPCCNVNCRDQLMLVHFGEFYDTQIECNCGHAFKIQDLENCQYFDWDEYYRNLPRDIDPCDCDCHLDFLPYGDNDYPDSPDSPYGTDSPYGR